MNGDLVPMSMVLWLNTTLPDTLSLKDSETVFSKDTHIINPAFNRYPQNSPMHGRNPGGNAVEAFVAWLQEPEQGFREVAL
jgi:hypothetical protein